MNDDIFLIGPVVIGLALPVVLLGAKAVDGFRWLGNFFGTLLMFHRLFRGWRNP